VVGTYDLDKTGYGSGRLIVLDARLEPGANVLHFEFSAFQSRAHDSRPLAIMLTDILVEPAMPSRRDELYGDSSSKQVLTSVWGNLVR
jgi:hypothetical protein